MVIPTYNGLAGLKRVLPAVLSQDYAHGYEVIVVDDGSTDGTYAFLTEAASASPGTLRPLRQENAGPARARNQGARAARGRVVAFLDDDCIPERSWLRLLLAGLKRSSAQAAGGAVLNPAEGWVGRYINMESVINHVVAAGGCVTDLVTGNAAVARAVFLDLGGFDEGIRVAGGEDTEFGLRLQACGHAIAHVPEARVQHDSRVGVRGYLRMIFRHGRGRHRLGQKFPQYRIRWPAVRLVWLFWPGRAWVVRDYLRYHGKGTPAGECLQYVALRYLENVARVAGYIRGR